MKTAYKLGAAAVVAFVLFSKKEKTKPYFPPSGNLPIVVIQPTPPDRTVSDGGAGGNAPIDNLGVNGANESEVETMTPKQFWRNLFVEKLNQFEGDLMETMNEIWQYWIDERNLFKNLFPTKQSLFLVLSTYVPDRAGEREGIADAPQIQWNSVPQYDTLSNLWNGNHYWTCTEWKLWHIELEKHYQDTYKANNVWLTSWNSDENQCSALYIYCPETSYCNLDCDFVEYLYSKDIDVSSLLSTAYCSLTNITKNIIKAGESIVNTGANVVHTVSNVSEGVKNTSGVLSYAIPALIVGYGIYYVTNKQ